MEKLTSLLPNDPATGQSRISNLSSQYETANTQKPSADYLAATMTLVSKAISLANAPALDKGDLLIRARDWAEQMFRIVPENKLGQAAKYAFENHDSSFPVNFHDIIKAYKYLQTQDHVRANQLPDTPEARERYCYNYKNHLRGEPEIHLYIPGVTETDVIVPCGGCRPAEFHQTKVAIIQQKKREAA